MDNIIYDYNNWTHWVYHQNCMRSFMVYYNLLTKYVKSSFYRFLSSIHYFNEFLNKAQIPIILIYINLKTL